ncbi:MAG: DegT/DnrJ/EryC1/StrS family aminotransferase [Bacteroidales bacterium]|nr:DegT/DnrJ/EryC1/StrS family aminotransferase [Bacteroidales bacterium]
MKKLQMVDLQGQYLKIKEEIDKEVLSVIGSSAFINGPAVKDFQSDLEQFLGVKHVVPCANGTDALQVSLMALGLKPGDEVVTTTFTFIATAEVIALLGLTPVLVDIDLRTFNIDTQALRRAITPRTRAIIPVHLFGQCADMDAVMSVAQDHDLYVIEDVAQAIGAEYTGTEGKRKAGTIGHIGCTSFFPSKNLGCYGDGGAVFTNDDALAASLRVIVNHGMTRRYYHDMVGVNSRLDSIQAAILRIKLRRLNEYNDARRQAAMRYNALLGDHPRISIPHIAPFTDHTYHQYTLLIKDGRRDGLLDHLQSRGIPCAIYYPVPLHLQKAYIDPRYGQGHFPVSEAVAAECISLPMHTELDEEQQAYIAGEVIAFLS